MRVSLNLTAKSEDVGMEPRLNFEIFGLLFELTASLTITAIPTPRYRSLRFLACRPRVRDHLEGRPRQVSSTSSTFARMAYSWRPEAVKANETSFDQTFCMSASWGSLIHATVGNFGGVGRPANRDGLAA